MSSEVPQEENVIKERQRLLEFQLNYLRKELLHLTHERYRMTYSVSGLIYRFLRPIESRIATFLGMDVKDVDVAEMVTPVSGEVTRHSANVSLAGRLLVDVTVQLSAMLARVFSASLKK